MSPRTAIRYVTLAFAVFLTFLGVVMYLAVAGVQAAPTPTPSPSSSSAALVPLFTCAGSEYLLDTAAASQPTAKFNNSINRLQMETTWTSFCGNKTTFSGEEINITGTNNCLTYAGPRSGTPPFGYVDQTTCTNKVSQQWTLHSNHLFTNAYTNSGWCMDGPQIGKQPFMEGCSTGDSGQIWYDVTI